MDSDTDLRLRLKAWMERVMAARGWSAETWAERANTAPTNVTRFLKTADAAIPSSRTLAKLGEVAGDPPPLIRLQEISATPIRVLNKDEICLWLTVGLEQPAPRVETSSREFVYVTGEVSANAVAVALETDAVSARGVVSGDLIVVDPAAPPVHGKIVVFVDVDGRVSAAVYAPPYLIPQSTNPAHVPLPIDGARIVGVALQAIKRL